MFIPDVELHEAGTLNEAVAFMTRYAPDARLLAGGTDLLVDLKAGRLAVGHLVSISRVDGLRGIFTMDGGLRIGALTTIADLTTSTLVSERLPIIHDAATQMAAAQIRNMATVGGNIASAVPCADLPPVLIVLDAAVELWSPSRRRQVPLASFFLGPRQTVLAADEVLTAVIVPAPPRRFGAAYARFGLRDGNAIAVASVAASLQLDDEDAVCTARIALGAVGPVPTAVGAVDGLLVGRCLDDSAIDAAAGAAMRAAQPISDVRGSAQYRRRLVGILTGRALVEAYRRSREARR